MSFVIFNSQLNKDFVKAYDGKTYFVSTESGSCDLECITKIYPACDNCKVVDWSKFHEAINDDITVDAITAHEFICNNLETFIRDDNVINNECISCIHYDIVNGEGYCYEFDKELKSNEACIKFEED